MAAAENPEEAVSNVSVRISCFNLHYMGKFLDLGS